MAVSLIESGIHERVLTVAFEKQSESDAMWALSRPIPFAPPTLAGAGGYFAPLIRAYIRRSGAPDHIGIMVGVKDRENALRNPYAHLQLEDISFEKVAESAMLWDPIRYLETCPSSDGACAMVLTDEAGGQAAATPPAWVLGHAMRSEPTMFAGRDAVEPPRRPGLRRRPLPPGGYHRPPPATSTWPRSTCRSAGTSRCGWRTWASRRTARAGR